MSRSNRRYSIKRLVTVAVFALALASYQLIADGVPSPEESTLNMLKAKLEPGDDSVLSATSGDNDDHAVRKNSNTCAGASCGSPPRRDTRDSGKDRKSKK